MTKNLRLLWNTVIIRIGKVFVGLVMPEVEGVMRLMSTSYAIRYFRQIVSGLVF